MAIATQKWTRREELLTELARDVSHAPERIASPESDPALAKLRQLGTQLWLDTGNLDEAKKIWRREMSALTTNNTLANQVVQTGMMDDVIQNAARRIREVEPGLSEDDLVMDIVFVVNSHIALRLVTAFDALVSVELHPGIAYDMEKTLRYAQRYYAVNPDRFIVKIPLTPEGYCAVAQARADGIPINYTLGFSARQNYLATLFSRPNYVNVFLGRLNQVVSENKLGDGKFVGEKATLASQAVVTELRESHPEIPTHQIAASMRNAEQMIALAGVDVFTTPPKAIEEFYTQNHRPEDITSRLQEQYEVTLGNETDKSSVEILWTVEDKFRKMAQELANRGGTSLTGDDLRQADRDHGTRLFTEFTPEETAAIRQKGKIPEVARWQGRVSLDTLMTESAIQSFTTDQNAFDDRIRQLIASS